MMQHTLDCGQMMVNDLISVIYIYMQHTYGIVISASNIVAKHTKPLAIIPNGSMLPPCTSRNTTSHHRTGPPP